MTKQKLNEQIASLSAVYCIGLEAMSLIGSKLELMFFQNGQAFSHEAKMHQTMIKQGLKRVQAGLEFFESNYLPLLVTDDGKTDCNSTSEAMLNDANQVARTLCLMYNKNVKNTSISEEVINCFNLKKYEDKGTDSPGSEESK